MQDGVFVLLGHQEVSDGLASLEIHLGAMFAADVLEVFTKPFGVWHQYVCVLNS